MTQVSIGMDWSLKHYLDHDAMQKSLFETQTNQIPSAALQGKATYSICSMVGQSWGRIQ